MTALGRKLKSRGHEVLFIGVPDVEPVARAANLKFESYCDDEFPAGSVGEIYSPQSRLRGLDLVQHHAEEISTKLLQAGLKHLPQKLVETGVKAVMIDTGLSFLQLVPMSLGIPFVQIWNNLHFDFSGATPLTLFGWPHETSAEARARNIEGVKMIGNLGAPVRAVAQAYAKENGLQIDWSDPTATTSKLAVITQTSREFDFEGAPWPAHFYYAGPLHDDDGRERVPFPWERLTGELLIYASLGTLVNGQPEILRTILGAVAKLAEFQVVLSIGKNISQAELGAVPPNTLVVSNAPQIELLKRAVLCITHARLNTTLESLAQGVPLVAIPIRIRPAWRRCQNCSPRCRRIHGSREAHRRRSLGASTRSPKESGLPNRGRHFRRVIARTRGLDLAADVIERVFLTQGAVARV